VRSTTQLIEFFRPESRRKLILRRGRERAVANRHPWIFDGSIERESGPADAAIADLVDAAGTLLASGFYSAHSQIRLRALVFGDETLTPELLLRRIAAAADRRDSILSSQTTAARLIHSEGDELSGVVVDRYGDLLVAEITSAGAEKIRQLLIDAFSHPTPPAAIYFKNDLPARRLEQLPTESEVIGVMEPEVEILENGLRFIVSVKEGQKTGFFLDQRDNRAMARSLASGGAVLNLFSYSGGFGVYAAAGGARSVEEVDISGAAIDLARRNHQRNPSQAEVSFTVADAFDHVRSLSASRTEFDLIVCDPPAFARSRAEVDRAARGYKDINLNALKLVRPGGYVMTFSCSGHMSLDLFQKVIFSAALDAGRRVSFLRRLGAGSDHPVSLFCPESEYLKGFLLQVHD
jgi:23S rRNA (cytosine1962-C5)-methyltransferase